MATTTPAAIRDRAITVIEALTPGSLSNDKFRRYRNEGDGDFRAWAEANPSGCLRRFQVRTTGATETPPVSNFDHEEHQVTLGVTVAYPQTARFGADQALDRDDVIDQDAFQIDKAIGMQGGANFTPATSADACWISGSPAEIERGETVDFLVLVFVYIYKRAR